MSAIISGYEYDIFISYRHNDNKSGWVTEFVRALEEELAATVKEPLTIYFDKNPHDGLLETHSVDKSLERKLKCLIFIPVISQTYYDPKSFAWQHEFCAFNTIAKTSPAGRDIRLANGNVASRILPVKIHDLDADDNESIEKELNAPLRAIEFIYREPGVNRPLRSSEEDPSKNLAQTVYRNQLNKVAQAIKQIIAAMKNPANHGIQTKSAAGVDAEVEQTVNPASIRSRGRKTVVGASLLIVLLTIGYFLFEESAAKSSGPIARSIAVLPFVDLSESKDQEWFADGLAEEIVNSLSHVDSLRVISRTSSFAFKGKTLSIRTIGDSLQVNYVVEGSVRKSPAGLRITAQLVRVKDGVHIWSNIYDRSSKDIFEIQSDIASKVGRALDVSLDPLEVKRMYWAGTKNADAYLAFLKGVELSDKAHYSSEFYDLSFLAKANIFFEEATRLDPEFVSPYLYHCDIYHHICLGEGNSSQDTISVEYAHRMLLQDLDNVIKHSKDESQKNYYRISRIMFSDDWSRLNEVIEKSLDDAFQERYKFQLIDTSPVIICLGHGDKLSLTASKKLETEPNNAWANTHLINNAMYQRRFKDVIQHSNEKGGFNLYAMLAMYQLGMFNEISDKLAKVATKTTLVYTDMEALMLARGGRLDEAKALMKKERRLQTSYIFAVDKIFGRDEANRVAKTLDDKPILHYLLIRTLLVSSLDPPFDISAIPNLVRRLKQAGVIIDQEKTGHSK
ncbi:MAG TPA: hypothetical protein VG737_03990 [Cyclobacteriaceae bacterium]|nr:hypothetical protein [Cyclobacteriaceae bacterium]